MFIELFKKLKYFSFLFCFWSASYGQDQSIEALCDNVFAEKTFDKQQDRHIAINDSLDKANQYKKEFAYIRMMAERCEKMHNKRLEAAVRISEGNFHLGNGNYIDGIEVFNRCIRMYDSLKEPGGMSTVHANIGNAYFYLQDIDKALYYYKQAISDLKKVKEQKPDYESRLANLYNSLGSIYCSKGDFIFGRTYFDLAYTTWMKHGDSLSISYIFNNYAEIFYENKKMDSALYYFNKALGMKMRHGDSYDKADANNNLSDYYLRNNDPKKALKNAFASLSFLDTTIYSRQLINTYHLLSEIYDVTKDYRNELKYYKLFKAASDSSDLRGQQGEAGKKALREEFDRIHLTDSIKAVEEIKLKDAKLSEKKQQTYFLVFILLLTVVVLALIYSRFTSTRKQKRIIEQKNREITDSINYARKIQQSILPNEKYIEKELNKLNTKG